MLVGCIWPRDATVGFNDAFDLLRPLIRVEALTVAVVCVHETPTLETSLQLHYRQIAQHCTGTSVLLYCLSVQRLSGVLYCTNSITINSLPHRLLCAHRTILKGRLSAPYGWCIYRPSCSISNPAILPPVHVPIQNTLDPCVVPFQTSPTNSTTISTRARARKTMTTARRKPSCEKTSELPRFVGIVYSTVTFTSSSFFVCNNSVPSVATDC